MTEPREEGEELTTLEPEKVSERNNGAKDLSLPSVEPNGTDYVGSMPLKKKSIKKKANRKNFGFKGAKKISGFKGASPPRGSKNSKVGNI